ncbi:MAG TPA: pyridoxal 5'-phosphate synthase glutaminase subunit PdxT [Desulfobacterales bacterium]|nr:pyridoxal 5'-phosphate synthase glutaminase subunit PdxT [Desulfobacterales bacterium]
MRIGVLALQGAFIEHIHKLRQLGIQAVEVRLPQDMPGLDGLIIPGGESTTIGKLMVAYDLMEPIRSFSVHKAVWGTCAGMILMAKEVGREQPVLGLMDITVERNAFGRQIDSFEADLTVAVLKEGRTKPFPAIFIRAPRLVAARPPAQVIARLADGTAVAAAAGRLLVTSFHPELSRDLRFHGYFLELVRS